MKLIPKQVDIEVTSACNLKCKLCPTLDDKAKVKHMDIKLFESIIDRINFDTTIVPWLNGEPLMHPYYFNMIKYITDRKLRCYITTNGMIWNDDLFELITDNTSCYQIIFSLDGLLQTGNIEKSRPGSDITKIIPNIERFLKLKLRKKSKIDVAVKICQRGQDWEEIENFVKVWLKVKGISFVCMGKDLSKINDVPMRYYPCQYIDNNFMVIKSDGRLVSCAYHFDMTNDPKNALGYLDLTTPLLDVYNNASYTNFRENQRIKKFHQVCSTCGFAYTGYGFEGKIKFRKGFNKEIYFHQDYYNSFFSLKKKWKKAKYYFEKKAVGL